MKKLVLIFVFLSGWVAAQVGPPDLRCLEVLPNGNVVLTWIPPSDPSNQFDSYDVFSSVTAAGPFSNVGSVPALPITTFTHNTTNGNTQSIYYFMRTKFGAGGTNISANSDTLRTIFLNATQSTPDIKLNYNNLRIPALNSTSSTYTISREYPAGIWSVIGTTTAIKYSDIISFCSQTLNYQAALNDASGCISKSNISGGIFQDTKAPDQPVFDSISVLANGQTVLAWHIPADLDIKNYIIYKNIAGTNQAIDLVNGRNNTIYTYTTTQANLQSVALYVAAEDSCPSSGPGGFDTNPRTMFLQTQYNICSYATQLTWNAYPAMPKGLKEYKIYYSVNGAVYNVVGTTTNTSFTHNGVAAGQNISYFVRAFNTDRSITASSNRAVFVASLTPAPAYAYIQSASVVNAQIEVNIFIDNSKPIAGINLLRSNDGSNFSSVAYLPSSGSQNYSFTDANVDVHHNSYYYQAVLYDSCSNARLPSQIAKTVLLQVSDDKENIFNKHLIWTDYKVFLGNVSGYNVYRILDDGAPNLVGSTGPFDTTYVDDVEDEAPNGARIKYYVEAVEGITNPYGLQEKCLSNVEDIYQPDKIFIPSAFAPNGQNKVWLPVTHFVDKSEYNVSVFNRWGNKVFETNNDKEGWNGKNCQPDVYVYLINYKNSFGEYKQLKGTVTLLE